MDIYPYYEIYEGESRSPCYGVHVHLITQCWQEAVFY